MKVLKKWQLLTLLLVNVVTFNACSSPSTDNSQASAKTESIQNTEQNQQSESKNTSGVQTELNKAKKAGKAVFVVVTGTGSIDTDKANAIAKEATAINKNSTIVQMNRDDVANASFVNEWRLSGAPLPLILVISPKGFPVGGFILSDATAQKIVDLIPSPKLDLILESINNQKPVFLVVSKKSFSDRTKITENCNTAKKQLNDNVSIIEVDPTDMKEAGLVKQLNISTSATTSSVIVLNISGQNTGTFDSSSIDTTQLSIAATKVIKSSCCPGGNSNGKSCK